MLNNQYIEILTGLKEAILEKVEEFDGKLHLFCTMEKRLHECPQCGTFTSNVHDYRLQHIKHTPAFGYPTIIHLRKRRHVCPCCGKRFFEHVSFLPKYQRTTNALWACALAELSQDTSMKTVAKRLSVSPTTIARILDSTSYSCSKLPTAISIDEFRGNSGGKKFQCILTDPYNKRLLDILPNRNADALCQYFSGFDHREQVKYVVMDLSPLFRNVACSCFPKAEIVADKFHALRLGIFALESIRKEVQKQFHHSRRKYFKRSRTLLIKHKKNLEPEELEQVSLMLSLSKPLAEAYYLKELIYDFFESEDLVEAKKRLLAFHMAANVANIPAFNTVSQTYREWEKELLNIFVTGLSNGFTEGCNNKIKVIKRIAYGMRNFKRFKARIMHAYAA